VTQTSDEATDGLPPGLVHSFCLFVAGDTPRNEQVVRELERVCRECVGDRFRLRVVDVHQQPAAAAQARILVAPTLIRETPVPEQRIIGDLTDHIQLKQQLGWGSQGR
jgi:circadian clock protein KaiB